MLGSWKELNSEITTRPLMTVVHLDLAGIHRKSELFRQCGISHNSNDPKKQILTSFNPFDDAAVTSFSAIIVEEFDRFWVDITIKVSEEELSEFEDGDGDEVIEEMEGQGQGDMGEETEDDMENEEENMEGETDDMEDEDMEEDE